MRFMKRAASAPTALAIGLVAMSLAPPANARDRYHHRHFSHHGHYSHHGHFGHQGAFIGGFAAGALLGALAQPYYGHGYYEGDYARGYYYQEPSYYYYQPAPRRYYREIPGYYGCGPGGVVSRPANSMC